MKRRALFVLLAGCVACGAPVWKHTPHDVRFQRTPEPRQHVMPKKNQTAEVWYALSSSTIQPLAMTLNPGHYIDLARGGSKALDINLFGQVVDSAWYENRIGRETPTLEAIRRGPNQFDGPAPGKLEVLSGKIEGATPGLVVRDIEGRRYVVKFDPAAFPGLASSAEVISTKILWAAGYHVPENHIGTLELDSLYLPEDTATADAYGQPTRLTPKRLKDLMSHANPFPDGTVRALFSRVVPGTVIGSFSYRGQRADDPNDTLPHERRRSLRGLWLFSAWLNNVDTRDANTIDTFISDEEADDGYLRHYLIDFGDALGSAGLAPKYIGSGYEGFVDWPYIFRGLFSFGIWYRPYLGVRRSPYRSVGTYESEIFEPQSWRANLPNPAFEEATIEDTYWAASIIARFTPEYLAAITDEAEFLEPGAKEWVLRVLSERQFRILDWVFNKVLPLDDPRADGDDLVLTDLAVACGLTMSETTAYRWSIRWNRSGSADRLVVEDGGPTPRIPLAPTIKQLRAEEGDAFDADPFLSITITRTVPEHGNEVEVHVRVTPSGILPVALERTTGG